MSVTSIDANWGQVGIRSPHGWVRSTSRVMAGLRWSWVKASRRRGDGRGGANDELGGEGAADLADRASLQSVDEQVRPGDAHLQLRHPDGGQRRLEQAGERDVVEADDR